MEDFNYHQLDPGVRRLVRWLRNLGFVTTDSGDGYTKLMENSNDPDVLEYPHVFMIVACEQMYQEAARLVAALHTLGIEIKQWDGCEIIPMVWAEWDAGDQTAVIGLIHVDDTMLPAVIPAAS
jgi:hypothetical protein